MSRDARRRRYDLLRARVREAVNQADPMALRRRGCPEDEYDLECAAIIARLRHARSAEDVSAIVGEEFERWFNLPPRDRPGMRHLGAEVWEAWERFREPSPPEGN